MARPTAGAVTEEPIVPGTNIADMPVVPPPQLCLGFDPARDGSLGERRCDRVAVDVVILGLVPTVMVPLCRDHAVRVIESAHANNIYAIQGGV